MSSIQRFYSALAALPLMAIYAASAEPELFKLIREILEGKPDRIYRDEIDQILSVELKDGALVGEFTDRIGAREIKRIAYKITPTAIELKIVNPEAVEAFAPMFGPGSKAKPKNCIKGLSCGNGCISKSKTCKKKPSPELKAKIDTAIALAEHIYPQTKNDFIKQKVTEAQARGVALAVANAANPPKILKKFPAVPAVAHSYHEVEYYEDAIAAGAARTLRWELPDGSKAEAKIGLDDLRNLTYTVGGTPYPYNKVLDSLKTKGDWSKVEKIDPLKSEDYVYV